MFIQGRGVWGISESLAKLTFPFGAIELQCPCKVTRVSGSRYL